MKYIELFSLELIHDYYADRRCRDFELEPTAETQNLLGNFRCLLKPLPNGIRILMLATDQNSPLISLPARATFGFHLRLQNPKFFLFTDLAELAALAAPYYTNSPPGLDLKPVSRETSTSQNFMVRQPSQSEAFVLSGRPRPGIQAADFRVNGLGAPPTPQSYDEVAKVIRVNSQAAEAEAVFTITYPTAPQLDRGVFADVEIQYSYSQEGDPAKFQVVFKAKKARWKYYVVTNKTDNHANLPVIEDRDNAIIFEAADRTDLTQTPDLADQIASELAKQYPDRQTYRFLSNALVPCQETARKAIQFQMNGDTVIGALPNPSLENFVIDMRDAKKEDSLYHIIQYINP